MQDLAGWVLGGWLVGRLEEVLQGPTPERGHSGVRASSRRACAWVQPVECEEEVDHSAKADLFCPELAFGPSPPLSLVLANDKHMQSNFCSALKVHS